MELNDSLLDFWIKHNYNVLMCGRRGTGKTTMIKSAFERSKLKWKYFSAPTMDPWVDFVGVPKEKIGENGNSYLELIRPKEFADDEIEVIFFDEFNRSKPKVIDAAMELIQFKSINGRKFNNLRCIWAAINPKDHDGDESEEYAVEDLDPAHRDRFQIQVDTEYKLNDEFFNRMYPNYADAAISWWNKLKDVEKNKVSPRRLEYALDVFQNDGDISYVLPKEINPSTLVVQLKNGSFTKKLQALFVRNDAVEIKKALMNENFYNGVKDDIMKDENFIRVFGPHFPSEKFNNLIVTDGVFKSFVLNDVQMLTASQENLKNIIEANAANPKIIKEIKEKLISHNLFSQTPISLVVEKTYDELDGNFFETTVDKMRICGIIQEGDLSSFTKDTIVKATTILGLIVCHNQSSWHSITLGLTKLKAEAAKNGLSFKTLMNTVIKDAKWVQYAVNDTKFSKVISDNKFMDDDITDDLGNGTDIKLK